MIFVGNQRGGARDLARHLMKPENERVEIHEIRGFVARDLEGAFIESQAISKATRCKQHLYSLSLNPPKEAHVTPELLLDAADRAEETLGLSNQPRAIVFHTKHGRMHAHAVWCRIDGENMRAVQMSFDRPKLQNLSRELYREHGWTMPRGFIRHEARNPRNYTLAEWQQAKRAGRDPAKLKGMIQDCWLISDSKQSFAAALKENGFILAKGDNRGAVAVDHTGEAFPVGRAVGIKSKAVKDRLGGLNKLPSREEAHRTAATLVTDRLEELRQDQRRIARERLETFAKQRRAAIESQRKEAERQKQKQAQRVEAEKQTAQARIRTGWRGLLDKVTGKQKRIEAENRERLAETMARAQTERDNLATAQEIARKRMMTSATDVKAQHQKNVREISKDITRLKPPAPDPAKNTERKKYVEEQKREAFKAERRRTPTAHRQKRRSNDPEYSRDGPKLER
ncbi:MAG: relaxase/mobilization nuclease domain-containing protein [Pseudomonadota bacterium]